MVVSLYSTSYFGNVASSEQARLIVLPVPYLSEGLLERIKTILDFHFQLGDSILFPIRTAAIRQLVATFPQEALLPWDGSHYRQFKEHKEFLSALKNQVDEIANEDGALDKSLALFRELMGVLGQKDSRDFAALIEKTVRIFEGEQPLDFEEHLNQFYADYPVLDRKLLEAWLTQVQYVSAQGLNKMAIRTVAYAIATLYLSLNPRRKIENEIALFNEALLTTLEQWQNEYSRRFFVIAPQWFVLPTEGIRPYAFEWIKNYSQSLIVVTKLQDFEDFQISLEERIAPYDEISCVLQR